MLPDELQDGLAVGTGCFMYLGSSSRLTSDHVDIRN
jgi:hypothetical protein